MDWTAAGLRTKKPLTDQPQSLYTQLEDLSQRICKLL